MLQTDKRLKQTFTTLYIHEQTAFENIVVKKYGGNICTKFEIEN